MPELPEVQTIVDDLNKRIVGRKVAGVWYDWPKTIKKPKATDLEKEIRGLKIEEIKRRGKNILIYLSKGVDKSAYLLLIHLKMTGHLLYGNWQMKNNKPVFPGKGFLSEKVNSYIHLIFYLDNGLELALSDLRKFAKVIFGPAEEIEKLGELHKIGPEPLNQSFKVGKFISLISPQRRKIKQVLMDPKVIAGIGNIYSDEILWQAKIHPLRSANSLKPEELEKIYKSIRQILEKALKLRGTSVSDFRDPLGKPGLYGKKLLAYRRGGEPCLRCGVKMKRLKMGGRSSCYCSRCQILK
ncbi:MAG: DNA-formamidopyrimidine glycosylase [Candidatus Wolfebacteria bacterium]|nr:DNA-formamidopyrimidine glycosylase [Candidatus Wolfebacteria bacterium]